METAEYVSKARNMKNLYDSPLVTRMTFDEGEIRLKILKGKLYAFSESYATQERGRTLYWVSKQIPLGYTPQAFLNNARRELINRIEETNNESPFDALDALSFFNRRFRANEEISLDEIDCSSIERALDNKIPTFA